MKINRNNYETFFLLYVDNELSAAEKKLVEEFVHVNSDLEPELRYLQESTLPAEPVTFESIDQLYKKNVELDTVQEELLLYMDNELNAAHKNELEFRIMSDHALQKELSIWEQTKLDKNEKVVFKEKNLLYHNGASRIVQFRYWRIAAAAAILLFGMVTGYLALKKENPSQSEIARQSGMPSGNTGSSGNNVKNEKTVIIDENTLPGDNITSNDDVQLATSNQQNKLQLAAKQSVKILTQDAKTGISAGKEKAGIAKTTFENINKQESNESLPLAVIQTEKIEKSIPVNSPVKSDYAMTSQKLASPSKPVTDMNIIPAMADENTRLAVFNDGGAVSNDRILYINQDKITRSRIGGVFRKVKRLIERNTNINTGNGVTIAGFEIAAN